MRTISLLIIFTSLFITSQAYAGKSITSAEKEQLTQLIEQTLKHSNLASNAFGKSIEDMELVYHGKITPVSFLNTSYQQLEVIDTAITMYTMKLIKEAFKIPKKTISQPMVVAIGNLIETEKTRFNYLKGTRDVVRGFKDAGELTSDFKPSLKELEGKMMSSLLHIYSAKQAAGMEIGLD